MRFATAFLVLAFAWNATAAPKVDDDDLPAPGEHKLELQLDKASRTGPAAESTARPLNFVGEYAYGMRENWQIAFKVPLAFERSRSRGNGILAELRYVAPHDDDKGGYWGVNVGMNYQTPIDEPHTLEAELVPVLGYRVDRWHAMANLGMSLPLRRGLRKVQFAPAAKLAYQVRERHAAGVEYFLEAGPMANWRPRQERSEYLFLAWDGALKKADFNVGIGRGLTDASDRWVLKLIYAFPL